MRSTTSPAGGRLDTTGDGQGETSAQPTGRGEFGTLGVAGWFTAVALLASVCIPTADGGGFGRPAQARFLVLAGIALVSAVRLDVILVTRVLWTPLAGALIALGSLAAISGTWTIGIASDALWGGLVIFGYVAVLLASSALAARVQLRAFAYAISAVAVIEALLGLHAAAVRSLPMAERIYGIWRPGGTYEYPPALALVSVCGLAGLRPMLRHRSAVVTWVGAFGTGILGVAIGSSGSRTAVALAALLVTWLLSQSRGSRDELSASVVLAIQLSLGVLVGVLLLGGHVPAGDIAPSYAGIAVSLAAIAAAAGVCVACRPLLVSAPSRRMIVLAAALLTLGVCATALASDESSQSRTATATIASHSNSSRGPASQSSVLHGRDGEWSAAVQTWLERPVFGSGYGSYFQASLPHQRSAPTLYAHNLLLELAAELGVLGLILGLGMYAGGCALVAFAPRGAVLLLGPTVSAFLVSNLLDWTWQLVGLTAMWAAACGALSFAVDERRRTTDVRSR